MNDQDLRDWFAGMALSGMYSASDAQMTVWGNDAVARGEERQAQTFAREAYEVANEMMKVREKYQ